LNSRVKHFYLVNRGKKDDRNNDYPYYGFGSVALYQDNLRQQEDRLVALESQDVIDSRTEKMIDQASDAVQKWGEKLAMMELYAKFSGKREMPEIAFEAHIRLESFIDTDYSAYVAVQSEVQKAVTELRNKEAKELFGTTYTAMNNFYQQKKTENTPEIRTIKKHMELIETLFPLKLIEVKPKR
jgi:hypothetical protein